MGRPIESNWTLTGHRCHGRAWRRADDRGRGRSVLRRPAARPPDQEDLLARNRQVLRHLSQHEGIDPETAPVSALRPDHVTSFAAILVPPDIRTPEEVSQMRTAQNNISAVRKFCSYLSSYDLNTDLAGDRIKTRIAAMMPRFTPPPPDVKLSDLEGIVAFVDRLPREEKPQLELRRLKVRAMIRFLFRSGVRVSELAPCGGATSIWPMARPASIARRAARAAPCTSTARPRRR